MANMNEVELTNFTR